MALVETYDPGRIAEIRAEAQVRAVRKAEEEAGRQYAKYVSGALRQFGNCAIVLMNCTSGERLMTGLEAEFGAEHVHAWKAQGTVQGEALNPLATDFITDSLNSVSSNDVILLKGVKYRDGPGSGTPLIAERLISVINGHARHGKRDETQPMMLLIGDGDVADLPTSGKLDYAAQTDVAADVFMRFAIYGDEEPVTFIDMSKASSNRIFY